MDKMKAKIDQKDTRYLNNSLLLGYFMNKLANPHKLAADYENIATDMVTIRPLPSFSQMSQHS